MHIEWITIGLGLLEGFALIISPCILPILPIILAVSLEGDKKRPLGIIAGFIVVFALFTLFAHKLIQITGIDLNVVRNVAFIFLLLFGVTLLSTFLTNKFNQFTQRISNFGLLATNQNKSSDLINGLFFGSLLAFIWTPCAGPILAAVIVQIIIQKTTFTSFLVILAFSMGAALPMLIIALLGRQVMAKLKFFKKHAITCRKVLGLIIIGSVVFMFYNNSMILPFRATNSSAVTTPHLIDGLSNPYQAPPLTGITAWINSQPLTLEQLKDKVVLIDFWAYSCINCVHTLPYLKRWYQQYHGNGFTIIGVHSPEFDFESNFQNLKRAVNSADIHYPVAADNNFSTWQNFNNLYWPAHYLIDKNGFVVYRHFGEGDYDTTENNIRYLLGLNKAATIATGKQISAAQTPETYLGYERANSFYSPMTMKNKINNYFYPETLPENGWALRGNWIIKAQKIIATEPNVAIKIHVRAKNVYAVMGTQTNKSIQVKLLLNGKRVIIEKGKDVMSSLVTVSNHALYHLIQLPYPTNGILELITTSPGLEIYTFTFG